MNRRNYIRNLGAVGVSIPAVSHTTFSSTVLPRQIHCYEYSHRTDAPHLDNIAQNYFTNEKEGHLTIFYLPEEDEYAVRLAESLNEDDIVFENGIENRLEAVHTAHRIVREHSEYSL